MSRHVSAGRWGPVRLGLRGRPDPVGEGVVRSQIKYELKTKNGKIFFYLRTIFKYLRNVMKYLRGLVVLNRPTDPH